MRGSPRQRGVVASVVPADVGEAAGALRQAPAGSAWFELRADRLGADDVAALVTRSGLPTIVTVRRAEDGGLFDGSETERRRILQRALDAGAAWIDVEENRGLAGWATGLPAERVILSHHGAPCRRDEMERILGKMESHPAGRLKVVPRIERAGEGSAIHDLLRGRGRSLRPLAAFGTGPAGLPTRVLALSWGSWCTYGAAVPDRPTAEGQPSAHDLLEVYDVLRIGHGTRRFGLAGHPVLGSLSPLLHAAGYRAAGLDAVYMPVTVDDLSETLPLCDPGSPFGFGGLGVTIPFKEQACRIASHSDPFVAACGAANTLRRERDGFHAFNTDGPAVLDLVRSCVDPGGRVVAVLGAGGTARAVALALRRAGASVVLFNRTPSRAAAAASAVGVEWQDLEGLRECRWDVLIQATPLGARGEDAFPDAPLRGVLVVDAAYGTGPTPLIERARSAGLSVFEGLDLLAAQAAGQFSILTGVRVPRTTFAAAAGRAIPGIA